MTKDLCIIQSTKQHVCLMLCWLSCVQSTKQQTNTHFRSTITQSREVRFPIRFLQMLHPRFSNLQHKSWCAVNLHGRRKPSDQITPTPTHTVTPIITRPANQLPDCPDSMRWHITAFFIWRVNPNYGMEEWCQVCHSLHTVFKASEASELQYGFRKGSLVGWLASSRWQGKLMSATYSQELLSGEALETAMEEARVWLIDCVGNYWSEGTSGSPFWRVFRIQVVLLWRPTFFPSSSPRPALPLVVSYNVKS